MLDKLALFGGRCLLAAEKIRARQGGPARSSTAYSSHPFSNSGPEFRIQSVDDLAAILDRDGASRILHPATDEEVRKAYYRWQFAAATGIAAAIILTDLEIEEKNQDGQWVAAPEHEAQALLDSVNPLMTGPELIYWTAVELLLLGRSWWRVIPTGLNRPGELWPLLGQVVPKIDETGILTGWKQTARSQKGVEFTEDYEPSEIVYLRIPKPGDLYGGMGAGQAAGSAIKLDQQIIESEWSAFKQGLFPFALVKLAKTKEPEKREELMNEFRSRYAGATHTGEAIGVGPNMEIEWPPRTVRDMGYRQGAEQIREEIFGMFRYPEAIAGISQSVNRSSAEGMEYIFSKWTVSPFLKLLVARINQDFVWRFWGRDIRLAYECPVPADREFLRRQRKDDLDLGVLAIDEARGEDGREALPDKRGALPYQSKGRVLVGEDKPPEKPPEDEEPPDEEEPEEEPVDEEQARQIAKIEQADTVRRRIAAEQHWKYRLRTEKALLRLWRKHFEDVGERVLAAWGREEQAIREGDPARFLLSLPPSVDRELDPDALSQEIAEKAEPINRGGLVLGADFQAALLENADLAAEWGEDPAVDQVLTSQFGPARYFEVCGETRRRMVKVVSEGIRTHRTWDELRLDIADEFGKMKESRAANIAVTETTRVHGAGAQAFRSRFEIPGKQWVCTFVNSRDTHEQADGQKRSNDENFNVGSDSMPYPAGGTQAKENCFCNCFSIPVLEPPPYR